MNSRLLLGASLIVLAGAAHAETCSDATNISGIELTDEYKTLANKARRLKSRSAGQKFLIDELPEALRGDVPEAAEAPVFTEGLFDEDGAILWVCDADGEPTPDVETYRLAFADFETALDDFQVSITARGDAIDELAEAGEAPQTAEVEGEGDDTGGDSPDEGSDTPDDGGDDAGTDVAEGGGADDGDAEDEGDGESDTAEAPEVEADGDTSDVARVEPMKDPNNPNLFRRVISLPGAEMRPEPNLDGVADPIQTFSVLYVFDESTANGGNWLKVGPSLREGTQGWIDAGGALDWSSMLVMEFAPKGKRSDVLFFENDTDLTDLVSDFSYAAEAKQLYESIEEERARLRENPDSEAQFDRRLVAIEPKTSVIYEDQPYLLPILDWRPELFDNTIETNLLKVAAIPANDDDVRETDAGSFIEPDLGEAAAQDGVFRVGVVFVVDTTISMRPFIERTYETIQTFYDSFQEFESASFVSFGLVGYRDDTSRLEDVVYTTEMFQPLDPEADPREVLANMRQMREADGPTADFKEDGFAGVIDAIEQNDWSPFDLRLVVMITDASSRSGEDAAAKYQGYNAQAVQELARTNRTALIPIHLRTQANTRNGDFEIAREQYQQLSSTGDINFDKYFELDAEDKQRFSDELNLATRELAKAIFKANAGQTVRNVDDIELEEIPDDEVGGIAAAVTNEVFRAQLESLAVASNGSAPSFLAGWTADRDFLDPDLETLEVSVFLTRNQLSSLDKRLADIVDAFRSGDDDPQAFFDRLQILAAETSTDPDLVRSDEREAIKALLPTFLQNLPYKSEVLGLDRQYWGDLGVARQAQFIEVLEAKRKIYQDIANKIVVWQSFGGDDPSLQVTPVSLKNLP